MQLGWRGGYFAGGGHEGGEVGASCSPPTSFQDSSRAKPGKGRFHCREILSFAPPLFLVLVADTCGPAVRLAPVNVALSSVQEVGAGVSVLWVLRLSHIQIDVGDMKLDILCKSTYRGHRSATHHQHLVTQCAAAEIYLELGPRGCLSLATWEFRY